MEKEINVYTEASDLSFHLTRTSIYSFVKTNTWFTGTLYLLVHPDQPLSVKNFDLLTRVYPNIKIHSDLDHQIFKSISKYRGKTQYLDLINAALKWTVFREGSAVLYFSNLCVFQNDVSEIIFDNLGKLQDTVQLFFSKTPTKLSESIYDDLNGSPLTSSFMNGVLNSYLNESHNPTFYPSSKISFSSKFPDSKIVVFRNTLFAINVLIFDSLNTSVQHTKVNQVWLFKNKEGSQFLNRPSSFNKSNINKQEVRQNIISQPKLSHSIIKIDDSELFGESYLSKRVALCTVCNDSFLPGALCMIHSFISFNPWFKNDIIIFHSDSHSKLSKDSQEKLLSLSPLVKLRKINELEYSKVFNRFGRLFKGTPRERFLPSFFTYEVFELVDEYDQVLFLDSDMLIQGNLANIFNLSHEIVVTPDAGEYNLTKNYSSFNGGFLLISNSINGKQTKRSLLNYSETARNYQLADQSIMNDFFRSKVKYLNSQYNCLKRCFPDDKFNRFDPNIKVIHYVGAKPWSTTSHSSEKRYNRLEKIWKNHYSTI